MKNAAKLTVDEAKKVESLSIGIIEHAEVLLDLEGLTNDEVERLRSIRTRARQVRGLAERAQS